MKILRPIGYSLFALLIVASACTDQQNRNENNGRSRSGAPVTGKVGQILVVCNQGIWDSDAKKYLDTNLTQFIMPYFPDVTTFELIHKTPERFDQGYKRYRNLLLIDIDPEFKGDKASIQKELDLYAYDQLAVRVTGKDYNQILHACRYGMDEVHEEFDRIAWERIIHRYEDQKDAATKDVIANIHDKFEMTLELPAGAVITRNMDSFMMVQFPNASRPIEYAGTGGMQEPGNIIYGVMIYSTPYVDSTNLNLGCLLDQRDTILKRYVPSEVEGMYMGTQYNKLVYPEGTTVSNVDGSIRGTEIRGMFMFTGRPHYSTGGCFWSYSFMHPQRKRIITISGWVDAPPTTSWTHFLREVQAVWKSAKIN